MADLWVKHNGVWKIPTAVWTKDNGVWRSSVSVHRNVGGAWQKVWPQQTIMQSVAIQAVATGNNSVIVSQNFTEVVSFRGATGTGAGVICYDDPDGEITSITGWEGSNRADLTSKAVYDRSYSAGQVIVLAACGRIASSNSTDRNWSATDEAGNVYTSRVRQTQSNGLTVSQIFDCVLSNPVSAGQSIGLTHNGQQTGNPVIGAMMALPITSAQLFDSDAFTSGGSSSGATRTVNKWQGGTHSNTITTNNPTSNSSYVTASYGDGTNA